MRAILVLWLAGCGSDTAGNGESDESGSTSSTPGGVSEEDFAVWYFNKYCDQLARCGSEFQCNTGSTSTSTGTTTSDCTYDPVAAEACLEDPWTCDELKFPVPADICSSVYTCPGSSGSDPTTR